MKMGNTAKCGDRTDGDQALRDAWQKRLSRLVDDVRLWAEESDWSTRLISKKMNDSRLGRYEAPALLMQKETTRILLDPIARFVPGAEGVVDLYLMPAYDDIATLIDLEGRWHLLYTPPPEGVLPTVEEAEPQPLTKAVLIQVLDEMMAHAASGL
jgi:hypothetical protein